MPPTSESSLLWHQWWRNSTSIFEFLLNFSGLPSTTLRLLRSMHESPTTRQYGTVPRSLRPVLRAYALGYITATGPRLFGFLRLLSRTDISLSTKINVLYTILKTSTEPNRFPAACAITVGGATTLPRLIRTILQWLLQRLSPAQLALLGPKFMNRLSFITSFLSAYLAFNLLNKDSGWSRKRTLSLSLSASSSKKHTSSSSLPPPRLAGKTIDFTLFTFTRALDVLAITLWTTSTFTSKHHPPSKTHPNLTKWLSRLADPTIFSLSAATIMHTWFYTPSLLPKSYVAWISSAAQIDPSLVEALRRVRAGTFLYGVDTGQAPLLTPLCRKLNLPLHWADPQITIPVPCELYHSGAGPSCEIHALSRFVRSFLFAIKLYLPLNLLSRLSNPSSLRTPSVLLNLLKSSTRSSTFLATFVTLFYYAVCLARTRLGPKLFSLNTITRQMWDSGLCVMAGCLACGWSILIETPGKRQELAFFVAPRALGTVLPRVYDRRFLGRERVVFAASVATVLTLVKGGNRGMVRGVFGRVLERVLKE